MPGIDSRLSLILLASSFTKPVIASRPAPRRGRTVRVTGPKTVGPQGGHHVPPRKLATPSVMAWTVVGSIPCTALPMPQVQIFASLGDC
jgi:hypothetical protein